MGIFINLEISKSVTIEEWRAVYQETLQLVKAFPLSERLEIPVRGIPTICCVPTKERQESYGWNKEKVRTGWFADGDYESLRVAETYFLPRDLVTPEEYCVQQALATAFPSVADHSSMRHRPPFHARPTTQI